MFFRNLTEQAKALFEDELLRFDAIPEGWKESSLDGIADYLNGLAMQKFRPEDDEEGRKLSNLRDELLPKLMSGEIDVEDIDI